MIAAYAPKFPDPLFCRALIKVIAVTIKYYIPRLYIYMWQKEFLVLSIPRFVNQGGGITIFTPCLIVNKKSYVRRRILFAGFVVRMEDTRPPKCVMFGELVWGAGCVGRQKNESVGRSLDGLRAFGINADQLTTAAQDKRKWRRTAEQGAERFMVK